MFYISCNKVTYSVCSVTSVLQMLVCLNYHKQHNAQRKKSPNMSFQLIKSLNNLSDLALRKAQS